MKTIEKIYDKIYEAVMVICKLFLIADVCITSYSVLGRYIGKYVPFIKDSSWSEEVVLTCMIYMAFLSASLGIRKQSHIRMTSLDMYLPDKLCQILDILADVLIIAFSMIMMIQGMKFASNFTNVSYVTISWLPRFVKYLPIPIAGFAIFLFELEVLYKHILVLIGKEV